jgi:hypothetical protein
MLSHLSWQARDVKATIGAPVYEMRVSAVSAADPTTPTPCPPFGDIGDAARRPLMFACNNPEDLSFPAGIGYTLPAHQLLRLEIHAWNLTNNALPVNTSTPFTVMSDSAYQHERAPPVRSISPLAPRSAERLRFCCAKGDWASEPRALNGRQQLVASRLLKLTTWRTV